MPHITVSMAPRVSQSKSESPFSTIASKSSYNYGHCPSLAFLIVKMLSNGDIPNCVEFGNFDENVRGSTPNLLLVIMEMRLFEMWHSRGWLPD